MYKLVFLFSFFSINSFSQELETTLHVYDKNGKHDSIIFGFNNKATNGIDTQFGERQILTSEIDTNFFICLAARNWNWYNYGSKNVEPFNITKKNIVPLDTIFGGKSQRLYVYLFVKDTPIRFEWDKEFFEKNFSNSFIISSRPGGWFDVGDIPTFLANQSFFIHLSKYNHSIYVEDTTLFNHPVHHYVFYIGIGAQNSSGIEFVNNECIKIISNPILDNLEIYSEYNFNYEILNISGQVMFKNKLTKGLNYIQFNSVISGIYFLKITNNYKTAYYKLNKQ